MKSISSLKIKQEIRKRTNDMQSIDEYKYSINHATSRANILNFLPNKLNEKQLNSFLMDCYYYKGSSMADLDDFSLIDTYNVSTPQHVTDVDIYKAKPTIFATFHMGSYRVINTYLNVKNFKSVLIVDTEVFESQTEHYIDVYTSIQKERSTTGHLVVLNADEQSTFFKLKQLIKEGYSLIVYLDGNMGAGSRNVSENKNLIPISLFGNEIYVRKGIGVLAKLLGAQIVPVISHLDKEKIHLTFYPEYNVFSTDDIHNSISYCYNLLEKLLVKFPEQWECWLYMHNWINLEKWSIKNDQELEENVNNKTEFKFNKDDYYLVHNSLDNTYFLFENSTYSAYEISYQNFNLLSSEIISTELINNDLKIELIQRGVLK